MTPVHEFGAGVCRGGPRLLPRAGRATPPARSATWPWSREAKKALTDPGHRQPQRHLHGRLGPLRPQDGGRRGRRPGAERLLHRRRRRGVRRGRGAPLPRPGGRGASRSVSIPLAVKVGPYFSSMGNMARRLVEAGADGLVLFNRFFQPDIDLEDLKVRRNVELSTSAELLLPLRWIAILHGRVERLAGRHHRRPHPARTCSSWSGRGRRRHDRLGPAPAGRRRGSPGCGPEMTKWMEEKEYESVEQLKGSMSQKLPRPGRLRARQLHEDARHLRHADPVAGTTCSP